MPRQRLEERVTPQEHEQVGAHDQEVDAHDDRDVERLPAPLRAPLQPGEQREQRQPGHHVGHVQHEDPAQQVQQQARCDAAAPAASRRHRQEHQRQQAQPQGVIRLEQEHRGPGQPVRAQELERGGGQQRGEERHHAPLPGPLLARRRGTQPDEGGQHERQRREQREELQQARDAAHLAAGEQRDQPVPQGLEVQLPDLDGLERPPFAGHHGDHGRVVEPVVAGAEAVRALQRQDRHGPHPGVGQEHAGQQQARAPQAPGQGQPERGQGQEPGAGPGLSGGERHRRGRAERPAGWVTRRAPGSRRWPAAAPRPPCAPRGSASRAPAAPGRPRLPGGSCCAPGSGRCGGRGSGP